MVEREFHNLRAAGSSPAPASKRKRMLKGILNTVQYNGQNVGKLIITEGSEVIFNCDTLELPYISNKRNISCIPQGEYTVKITYSNSYNQEMYEVLGVPGRAGIRIHPANFVNELRGCIAIGKNYTDINKDGKVDLLNSKKTYEAFMEVMNKRNFILNIKRN